ncbi:5-histidylcysteine sulfoxide synthase [Photobacterium ganghwense]|uniref:SAM-dependent methyltransferase n=1 Tax=Photobacterium ganghwense TaxID=320778 RepID=A0A0J1GY36_9GAMM|nr:5-histidylcysteine sulfoxide synthase [Photobacterium ganghwense]KLV04576.1 SAM-dependent methyltransferase [Photobacterium ganghwense]PSU09461.1 5-histidylcysteine sulfoxide synthase [Photobacterium ganghwense]QSV16703.1 5-histidylcysteine sulfoxide synthase [Photobacterium ganghwense]
MESNRQYATRTVPLTGQDPNAKRHAIKNAFNQTWQLYESLFDVMNNDQAYFIKAEPLRHPLIFYFGHTATFYINKLKLAKLIDERVNEHFESMFAIGVDEMSWDDLDENNYDWPTVDAVRHYRQQVNALINQLIDTMPLQLPITPHCPAWVILMGIEHERIHLETSSVIIRQLPLSEVTPHPEWSPCDATGRAPSNCLLSVSGGHISLGKSDAEPTYGWDNEYGQQSFHVEDFKASKYLVSNQEYLEFINAEGYRHTRFWNEEGKAWLAYTKATMPRFWRYHDGQWLQRNLTEEIPLPLNWPVEVNQLEAKAFCNWKAEQTQRNIRLLTEAEWYLLRHNIETDSPDWDEPPGNIELSYFASSCPVDRFEHEGFCDIVGNVWQWTETCIDGFPGFQVHPLYDDFSTPTFDGQHNLIKGGSWISTGNESIKWSRYAFRRHFYQHAGFRYVESRQAPETMASLNIYETDELISQYLEFHYGAEYFSVPNFCVNGVKQCLQEIQLSHTARALDIGCSVGRASFELARTFKHVDAIDFSARFIQQAYSLTEQGEKRYTIKTEGELVEFKSITLEDLGYTSIADKINFVQGDACNLKPQFTGYDLVYASNLVDRLGDPKQFLSTIHQRINDGGYLVIASPYTWLSEYTPKEKWLGGFKVHGENFTTLDGLTETLIPHFELIAVKEIPFVIRETKRKFQHTVSEMTIWRKREGNS